MTGCGYDIRTEEFVERPRFHDDGEKTFFGCNGVISPVKMFCNKSSRNRRPRDFITAKLWNYFAGEPPSDALATALAGQVPAFRHEFRRCSAAIFYSEEFYSDSIVRNQVKSPA